MQEKMSRNSAKAVTQFSESVAYLDQFKAHELPVHSNPKQYGDHNVIVGSSDHPTTNIIDTSMPHTPWETMFVPGWTTEPVSPVDDIIDTSMPPQIPPVSDSPYDDADTTKEAIVCGIPPGAHDNGGYFDVPNNHYPPGPLNPGTPIDSPVLAPHYDPHGPVPIGPISIDLPPIDVIIPGPHPYVPSPTSEPGPVGVEIGDGGGFTISIDAEGTVVCADPAEPIDGGIICYIPPSAYDDRLHGLFLTAFDQAPATPLVPAAEAVGSQIIIDGGFTVYMDAEGNTVCGTPPCPVQTAIDHFVIGTEKTPISTTEPVSPSDTPSFAEIHGHFDLPANTADVA